MPHEDASLAATRASVNLGVGRTMGDCIQESSCLSKGCMPNCPSVYAPSSARLDHAEDGTELKEPCHWNILPTRRIKAHKIRSYHAFVCGKEDSVFQVFPDH
jgi:hypothetical protein